jgi:hypothetical protein
MHFAADVGEGVESEDQDRRESKSFEPFAPFRIQRDSASKVLKRYRAKARVLLMRH